MTELKEQEQISLDDDKNHQEMQDNEYYLVLVSSQRAYDIAANAESCYSTKLVDADVAACKEIEKGDLDLAEIENAILYRLQSNPASNYVPFKYSKFKEEQEANGDCGDEFDYLDLNNFDNVFEQ